MKNNFKNWLVNLFASSTDKVSGSESSVQPSGDVDTYFDESVGYALALPSHMMK